MAALGKSASWLYHEFGLDTIFTAGRNAWLIILARTCRMFAYGTSSLMLALFFAELKFSDSRIGLFMSLTLTGDVVFGLLLTVVADRVGRRRILFGGSFLMVISGVAFALFENFWILLIAAVVGVVSTTGGDFGPFRAIEESILSHLTTPQTRSDVLSWYVTLSTLGSSLGSEASGRLIELLRERNGWTLTGTYHAIFSIYAIMGLVNAGLVALLTSACESDSLTKAYKPVGQPTDEEDYELDDQDDVVRPSSPELAPSRSRWQSAIAWLRSFLAGISAETRTICYKLWALLTLDSLSDGMVPYSLTNYYMDLKFHPSKATLGDVTSIAYLLSTIGTLFAAPLARRIGLINTMVFTHVPSSAAVLLFPAPTSLWLTVLLMFVRSGLNNMDQAPRAAFIAAVVKPEERTAVMGITTMVRTLGATAGPTVTGALAGNGRFWVAFVAGGSFRLAYDIGLYTLFVNMKLHKHETPAVEEDVQTEDDGSEP